MTLKELREHINKLDISKDTLEALNKIIDRAINAGSITDEERRQIADLMQLEKDTLNTEADSLDELANDLEQYNGEMNGLAKKSQAEIEKAEDELDGDINNIITGIKTAQVRSKIDSM